MSNTCKNFWNPKIGKKWLSMGPPPVFSPEIFFTKMTQNGLKWILNTTFKNVTFCRWGNVTFVTIFFLKASLRNQWALIWRSNAEQWHYPTRWCLNYEIRGRGGIYALYFLTFRSWKVDLCFFLVSVDFSVLSGDFSDISVISDFPSVISHTCLHHMWSKNLKPINLT